MQGKIFEKSNKIKVKDGNATLEVTNCSITWGKTKVSKA